MRYTTLVLSGGGLRGFGLLGGIQYIQDKEWLKDIHKFVGTSIGAIIVYLLCIGYSPTEIMVSVCQRHQKIFEKLAKIDVMNVIQGMGAVSFSTVYEYLEKMTLDKIKKHVTFHDLYYKYNKELVCCTYNETLGKTEFISYLNHPDMDCLIALRMSANFPFLFDPFIYDDYSYIDGGIVNNFPIDQILPEERVIGLHLRQNPIQREHSGNENLIGRVSNIIFIPIQKMEDIIIEKMRGDNVDVINIPIPISMLFHFTMSTTDKFDMFSIGYNSTREYFEKKKNPSTPNDDDFVLDIV